MIALAIAVGVVAASAVACFGIVKWAALERHRIESEFCAQARKHEENTTALQLDRDRFESTRPVAPHEDLVKRVTALEAELNAVRAWAKR